MITTTTKYRRFIHHRIKSHYFNKVGRIHSTPLTRRNNICIKAGYKYEDEFGDFGIGTMIEANKNNPTDFSGRNHYCGRWRRKIQENNPMF